MLKVVSRIINVLKFVLISFGLFWGSLNSLKFFFAKFSAITGLWYFCFQKNRENWILKTLRVQTCDLLLTSILWCCTFILSWKKCLVSHYVPGLNVSGWGVLFNWLKFLRFALHMQGDLSAFRSTSHLLKGARPASFTFVLEVICPALLKRICFCGDVWVHPSKVTLWGFFIFIFNEEKVWSLPGYYQLLALMLLISAWCMCKSYKTEMVTRRDFYKALTSLWCFVCHTLSYKPKSFLVMFRDEMPNKSVQLLGESLEQYNFVPAWWLLKLNHV